MRDDRALCIADCVARGQHAPDCTDEECGGCVPRLAVDGVRLCGWHLDKLAADPLQLAELHTEIGLRLVGSGSAGEKTSGTRNPGLSLDERAVQMRDEIKGVLTSWASMICEERGWTPPPDEVDTPSTARCAQPPRPPVPSPGPTTAPAGPGRQPPGGEPRGGTRSASRPCP